MLLNSVIQLCDHCTVCGVQTGLKQLCTLLQKSGCLCHICSRLDGRLQSVVLSARPQHCICWWVFCTQSTGVGTQAIEHPSLRQQSVKFCMWYLSLCCQRRPPALLLLQERRRLWYPGALQAEPLGQPTAGGAGQHTGQPPWPPEQLLWHQAESADKQRCVSLPAPVPLQTLTAHGSGWWQARTNMLVALSRLTLCVASCAASCWATWRCSVPRSVASFNTCT